MRSPRLRPYDPHDDLEDDSDYDTMDAPFPQSCACQCGCDARVREWSLICPMCVTYCQQEPETWDAPRD
jgi:hypothetical protein